MLGYVDPPYVVESDDDVMGAVLRPEKLMIASANSTCARKKASRARKHRCARAVSERARVVLVAASLVFLNKGGEGLPLVHFITVGIPIGTVRP